MAELFEDNRPSVLMAKRAAAQQKESTPPPVPQKPAALAKQSTAAAAEEQASMEQLELDLKSILSEISQLGNKDRESTAWMNKKASLGSSSGSSVQTPAGSDHPTSDKEPEKDLPKFCHQCGTPYPQVIYLFNSFFYLKI